MFALAKAGGKRYPDDPQMWNNLGEVREHAGWGPHVGVTLRARLAAFARAIALDSSFASAYVQAISLAFEVMGPGSGLRYARQFRAQPTVARRRCDSAADPPARQATGYRRGSAERQDDGYV
jgi:hypothetical protein